MHIASDTLEAAPVSAHWTRQRGYVAHLGCQRDKPDALSPGVIGSAGGEGGRDIRKPRVAGSDENMTCIDLAYAPFSPSRPMNLSFTLLSGCPASQRQYSNLCSGDQLWCSRLLPLLTAKPCRIQDPRSKLPTARTLLEEAVAPIL